MGDALNKPFARRSAMIAATVMTIVYLTYRGIVQLQEITARKRTEDTFDALLESTPDAMIIVDRQGQIVLVNARPRRCSVIARTRC